LGCLGVHFALSPSEAQKFLDAESDEELMELIEELEERDWENPMGWLFQQSDKSWDAMHRALTDGTLHVEEQAPYAPLSLAVLGGQRLYEEDDYIIAYVNPIEVKAVAEALQSVDKERLRAGYNQIDEEDYGIPTSEDDFEYTWEWFEEVKDFYRKAASEELAVLFTADQ
jgi:transcriptional/translational regulatory protein YebC/TACO1